MNEFDDLQDVTDIIIAKDENGNDKEFIILDTLTHNNIIYLLVIESESAEDEESEATILKEVKENENDDYVIYTLIDSNEEFDEVIKLLQNNNNEYSIEL